jgi:GNAT superfamily N-acetyltransferase
VSAAVKIRAATEDDWPYIVDTWIRSEARHGASWRVRKAACRALLDHEDTLAIVAHLPDDEGAIVGWAVYVPATRVSLDTTKLRWAYVRRGMRGEGVFRALRSQLAA